MCRSHWIWAWLVHRTLDWVLRVARGGGWSDMLGSRELGWSGINLGLGQWGEGSDWVGGVVNSEILVEEG